jgi:preprotein translocase subunit SecA
MRTWWRSIAAKPASVADAVEEVRRAERSYAALDDEQLAEAAKNAVTLTQVVAVTTVLASRVLGLGLFDVQLHAALALTDGKIVEMQTGEGKTVAAVPAIAWFARSRQGVHVLTANDYLARRDARWMGGIYERLGLSVGVIQQHMTSAERRAAYRCDVTYGTANEVGFDYLRDQLALHPDEQVLRPFAVAVCDEADSALIDRLEFPGDRGRGCRCQRPGREG